ncbi:DUF3006 domain-containing protein [Halobacillus sp. A5]|uniref:DUF3006 domain-containing protein n=1 Tax=Halobacillus sp. A5 TaxID=2880263 RepID=UPI0020A6846B|nr:DUF3006 domain-containing protein [Halobacillus sp. A5]MCP3029030.1 DUF3006 domain-containing protein [Halobacillus sp. A5]
MNTYTLDRYEGTHAILIETDRLENKLMVFKERLIEFAQPGDIIAIDFDHMGNLRHVEVVVKHSDEPLSDLEGV